MMRVLATLLALSAWPAGAVPVEGLVAEAVAEASVRESSDPSELVVRYAPPLPDAVAMVRFWHDDRSGRFAADLLVDDGSVRRIAGTVVRMARVPVPIRDLRPGEILRSEDIGSERFPERRLPALAVLSSADLLGREAERLLPAGRPIVRHSVRTPLAVRRGDRLSIVLAHGGLVLTAPGKALSDAAAGTELRVVNVATNRTVSAVARPDGSVEVVR